MKRESLKQEVTEGVKRLLDLARDLTFNPISDNCLYIISEIKHSDKNACLDWAKAVELGTQKDSDQIRKYCK